LTTIARLIERLKVKGAPLDGSKGALRDDSAVCCWLFWFSNKALSLARR
jgi:hypothetical protein